MKTWCALFAVLISGDIASASAPAPASQPINGWQADREVSGTPLTITWEESKYKPECILWLQDFTISEPFYMSDETNTITIPRQGRNELPERILIIPEENTLKPKIIDVSPETEKITFVAERIPKNEVYFWGFTPQNQCSPPSGPTAMGVSVRLVYATDVYAQFNGAFLWHIALNKNDKYEKPFYFYPHHSGTVKEISIAGFAEANDVARAACRTHTRKECDFILTTSKESWGKSHQIVFERNSLFDPAQCPVY
ncbi:MAG: hypothetical protein ABIJ96_05775 [Elusimicrobiota bacterium]